MKKKFYWRKLDHQAKIFSLVTSKKYNSIFRLSAVLNERIDKNILKRATEKALNKYISFKVKVRNGVFWNYLEKNEKSPVIWEEIFYPFEKVNTSENNEYLFRVSYYERKINIEFYHILTDGNRGMTFFKEIISNYLELKNGKVKTDNINIIEEIEENKDLYVEYIKNYKKLNKKVEKDERAYMLKGETLREDQVAINHFIINLEQLKKKTKTEDSTIGIYLTALIVYAIYEANYKVYNGKKAIKICIPVDLEKYFNTNTMSNFFTYIAINIKLKSNKSYSFIDILQLVKKEFKTKLEKENLANTIKTNVRMTNNLIVRMIPLLFKKIVVKIGSKEVKRHFTMTISNIGKIEMDEKYKKDIQGFMVMLSPDWAEKIKCGICSYENILVLSIDSLLKDNLIEKTIYDVLVQNNIKVEIEGNGVKNVISN